MDYTDLRIMSADLTIVNGVEQPIDGRASIGQDIKHMILDSGLLVDIVGERNPEAVKQNLIRIESKVDGDIRIVPGTARVTRTDNETFFVSAKTVKYGALEVYL